MEKLSPPREITQSITSAPPVQQEKKKNTYFETAWQETLIIIGEVLTSSGLKNLKVKSGNQSLRNNEEITSFLKEEPTTGFVAFSLLDPALEEAIFRLLPSKIIDHLEKETQEKKSKAPHWEIGIPISALFAFVHNIEEIESENKINKLKITKSIPLPQFIAGLFFWYLMREKGYSHAVLAHSMNNSVPLVLALLLEKVFPENQKKI